jgi:hypothetical protein
VSHDGNTLKPLSPVWITGTREENGDLTISWVRRARINAQWMDSYDVPLDEPTEAYEVDIYSDGSPTVARTLTSATTSVTYTAAQQAEDFGGSPTPASFSIAVYQISAIIGRGHAGTATI